MAKAYVVGGQRQPGPVRLGNVLCNPLPNQAEITGTSLDTANGVQAVGDAHFLGGNPRKHHQPPDASGGNRIGHPMGLLVADGGKQAPVNAVAAAASLKACS